jgi:hypothetical protein
MRVPAQSLPTTAGKHRNGALCFDLYYSACLVTNASRIKPAYLPACASYAFFKSVDIYVYNILENLRVQ